MTLGDLKQKKRKITHDYFRVKCNLRNLLQASSKFVNLPTHVHFVLITEF